LHEEEVRQIGFRRCGRAIFVITNHWIPHSWEALNFCMPRRRVPSMHCDERLIKRRHAWPRHGSYGCADGIADEIMLVSEVR
jgi:hypothetical protein